MLREREQEKPCAQTTPERIFVNPRNRPLDLGELRTASGQAREEKRGRVVYGEAEEGTRDLAIVCNWSGCRMVISRPLRWTISEP